MGKNKRKKFHMKRLAVRMLFIGVLIYAGYTLVDQQIMLADKNKEIESTKAMTVAETEKQARLEEELSIIETDEYKEQKARELLGYIKPDERIYIDVTK